MNGINFDPVIHPPNRLHICALLAPVTEMEFATVCAELGVSDSVLSKQTRYLEEAGYLKLRKATSRGRQRTWLSLTARGRKAYARHIDALKRLAAIGER